MNIYYTYLLKSPCGRVYYGVKYSKAADPKKFWISYFTSSKEVKDLRSYYGDDKFTFEIRRTFPTPEDAIVWERKVLRRINADRREDFINSKSSLKPRVQMFVNKDGINKNIAIKSLHYYESMGWSRGQFFSEDRKRRMSESAKKRKPRSQESKKKTSESLKGRIKSDETRKKISQANRGKVRSDEMKSRLKNLVVSDETRKKISQANKGKPKNPEQRRKMSESHLRRNSRKDTVPKVH